MWWSVYGKLISKSNWYSIRNILKISTFVYLILYPLQKYERQTHLLKYKSNNQTKVRLSSRKAHFGKYISSHNASENCSNSNLSFRVSIQLGRESILNFRIPKTATGGFFEDFYKFYCFPNGASTCTTRKLSSF